jgi:octaprenyl-diphosphate synthase
MVIASARERLLKTIVETPGLKDVEAVIKSKLVSDAPLLEEIPTYLLSLGGKRVRPLLALLVGRAAGLAEPKNALIDVAAGIELIHMATLLHDDIIDKSPLRRHKESALVRYGVGNTLLSGDFLLVRAFSLCAKLSRYIIEATEIACIELTEGEILEIPLHLKSHTLESSLDIASKKTASLFRLSAQCGAHIAGLDGEILQCFSDFGLNLGIAFQILDDILDIDSDEKALGKKSGTDILERKPSVVNLLWLGSGSALSKSLLKAPAENDAQKILPAARLEIVNGSVLRDARKLALEYHNKASKSLKRAREISPDSKEGFSNLEILLDFTLERIN